MRNFALPVIFSVLLLTACERIYMVPPVEADRTASNVLARAAAGDGRAQLEAASDACVTQAGIYDSDPSTALRWWKKAAANRNPLVSYEANRQLGEYYLAEYVDGGYWHNVGEKTYRPGEYKKIAKCRGDKGVKPDYKRAAEHFKKCANNAGLEISFASLPPAECRSGLGHLNYIQKDYAEALYWYLTVTALSDMGMHNDPEKWAAGVKSYKDLMRVKGPDAAYARYAAEHLTPAQKVAAFRRAKAYLVQQMDARRLGNP